ncbi:DUF4421 family protein [Flagellimonas zhangzhouensis]|uniref:Outer membrane protein beta-barrel domain-containing protein n=1 Tax=Flagellimonas zhangzhouensis TaxID=1073328 RepID=A0A1H2WRV0_9FLAO|nr:DUF4421 family protein [Allomuricauda zhangzhouensis]SDQ24091.1 Outer membrane protein beta-barrel domain-containing protein [Allomuricauda zhangzhouensis]SDW83277.1 Outer membrane protein beta-barrel domain-containing protein [Allomuricauda zhangzhouensis]
MNTIHLYFSKSLRYSFILFALIFIEQSFGQEDENRIKSYVDQLAFGVDFSTDLSEYVLHNNDLNFHLVSNNDVKMTMRMSYKFLDISFGFAPGFLPGNDDDELKGESSFTEYSVNLFPKQFVQNLFYRRMKGFYVENTEDFFPLWQEGTDPYFQFSDLKSIEWGGYTGFVLNKDFSLRALLSRQEWQMESSGSFVPALRYDFTKMTNPFDDGSYGKENQVDLRADLGYYYNWVVTSNVNIAPYVRAGIGPKFSKYTLDGVVEKNSYFVFDYGAGFQVGYNTDKLYMGVRGNYNGYSYKSEEENTITNNLWHGLFFVGYRFNAPEKLKKLL